MTEYEGKSIKVFSGYYHFYTFFSKKQRNTIVVLYVSSVLITQSCNVNCPMYISTTVLHVEILLFVNT